MVISKLIMPFYTKMLERSVSRGKMPSHIMIVGEIVDLEKLVEWCEKFGIREITVCSSNGVKVKSSEVKVNVVTLSGREEIVLAVRKLAGLVESGKIDPAEINENLFEKFLEVKSPPDLIIRAGEKIPDFLIWQSIYSELYFADVNWKRFRYVDFLRCLREYQRRERRYGR